MPDRLIGAAEGHRDPPEVSGDRAAVEHRAGTACDAVRGVRRQVVVQRGGTRAQLGPRPFPLASDDVYEVINHVRHSEPVDVAGVVNLVWLDGPRSAEQQAADELSGTRIKRALETVDGLTDDYVLRRLDGAMVVAAFARGVEAIEATSRAIMNSELLPGEDPALLAGPDRTMLCRVDALTMAQVTV